ncbi:MAG: hypothetical protein CVU05_01930, partial [Bacteroidetes bacterium HGW-Bacteroidetes-21]
IFESSFSQIVIQNLSFSNGSYRYLLDSSIVSPYDPDSAIQYSATSKVIYKSPEIIRLKNGFQSGDYTSGFFSASFSFEISFYSEKKCDDTTGVLFTSIYGGVFPFSYLWNTADTTSSISFPDLGTYTVTVTDSRGVKAINSYTVLDSKNAEIFAGFQSKTFHTCNGYFYDSGGDSEVYGHYEDYSVVFYPCDSTYSTVVDFKSFKLDELNHDWLAIYDGSDTLSTLIGKYYSNSNFPGVFSSTHPTGALTFVFHSDGNVVGDGWDSRMYCVDKSCTQLAGLVSISGESGTCESSLSTVSLSNSIGEFQGWLYSYDNVDYYEMKEDSISFQTMINTTTYFKATVLTSEGTCTTSPAKFETSNNYYVNDENLDGDKWCTDIGKDSYNGLTINTPKFHLDDLINTYVLKPCDTIFVDNGLYEYYTEITNSDTGEINKNIVIYGASNDSTIFTSSNDWNFKLNVTSYFTISNIQIVPNGTFSNIYILNSNNINVENCKLLGASEGNIDIVGNENNGSSNILIKNNNIINESSGAGVWMHYNVSDVEIQGNTISSLHSNDFCATVYIDTHNETINNINILNNFFTIKKYGIRVINTIGSVQNTTIQGNVFDLDSLTGVGISMENTTDGTVNTSKISENLFYKGVVGIMLNNGVKNFSIHNNFFSSNEIGLKVFDNASIGNKVYFNSFYNLKNNLYFSDSLISSWKIKNNIFYTYGNDTTYACLRFNNLVFSISALDYNLYHAPNNAYFVLFNNDNTTCNNLTQWDNACKVYGGGNEDENSIEGDPAFMLPDIGNLNIDEASIANSAGTNIDQYTTDFNKLAFSTPPPIGAATALILGSNDAYAELKRELDGSYCIFVEQSVNVHYFEEYNVEQNDRLNYRIYMLDGAHLTASTRTVYQTGSLSYAKEKIKYGNNWLRLSFSTGMTVGMYLLEVENLKKEKFYLRFKYKPSGPFVTVDFMTETFRTNNP